MRKKRGGKYGGGTEGKTSYDRKGRKSSGRRNSLRNDALENLYREAHVLTLRASLNLNSSPFSLDRYKSTKAVILITVRGRVISAAAERPREETLDGSSGDSILRGGSRRSRIYRYFETSVWEVVDRVFAHSHT